MHRDELRPAEVQFLTEHDLELVTADSNDKLSGVLDSIDLEHEEVWLMQAPKSWDVLQLKQQKLKIPGRTHLPQMEVFATEFVNKPEQAIGYALHDTYKVRLLPVTGSIVVRDNLKSNKAITTEQIEGACQHAERPTLPDNLKDRHPLLGHDYKGQLRPLKSIIKRLKDADHNSATITKVYRQRKQQKPATKTTSNNSASKKNKTKRHAAEPVTTAELNKRLKIKEEVSEDLKWLENV